jgi:hypothetical protein
MRGQTRLKFRTVDIRARSGLVRFWAMVAHVDSTSRSMCTSRARDFYVPRSFLFCVLSLWLTLSAAHALDPNKRLAQYAHTAWRIQDGFLPNTPFWISQTKDEYLWVGGGNGALRFDGVRFTPWSAPIASPPCQCASGRILDCHSKRARSRQG